MPVVQTLDARYIEGAKLVRLLKQLFGAGNFKIDVRLPNFSEFAIKNMISRHNNETLTMIFIYYA